jgi:hypothetical protein
VLIATSHLPADFLMGIAARGFSVSFQEENGSVWQKNHDLMLLEIEFHLELGLFVKH